MKKLYNQMNMDRSYVGIKRKLYIFGVLFLLAILFKTLSCAIPGGRIMDHIYQSSIAGRPGENYVCLPITIGHSGELDYATEANYLNMCIAVDAVHPFGAAVKNTVAVLPEGSVYEGGAGALTELLDKNTKETRDNPVYWWGAITILRPFLYLFSYDTTMTLIGIVLQLLWLCTIVMIYRYSKGTAFPAFCFALCTLLVKTETSYLLLCTAMPLFISYISMICIAYVKDTKKFNDIVFVCGIATAYLDWMSTPIVTFAFSEVFILMVLHYKDADKSKIEYLTTVISGAVNWCVGYAGMLFGKWILSSVVLHKNIILEGLERGYADSTREGYHVPQNFFVYVWTSFYKCTSNVVGINLLSSKMVFILCLMLFIVLMVVLKYAWKMSNVAPFILLSSLAPMAWLVVFRGHIFFHSFFTYRMFSVLMWGILLFFYYCLKPYSSKHCGKLKGR